MTSGLVNVSGLSGVIRVGVYVYMDVQTSFFSQRSVENITKDKFCKKN